MEDQTPDSRFKQLLFSVSNHHTPDCGEPPLINGDARNRYYGYFENEHGEQFVFVFDYETQKPTLWVGDVGWEKPEFVMEGKAPNVFLDPKESAWLQACWDAAMARIGK